MLTLALVASASLAGAADALAAAPPLSAVESLVTVALWAGLALVPSLGAGLAVFLVTRRAHDPGRARACALAALGVAVLVLAAQRGANLVILLAGVALLPAVGALARRPAWIRCASFAALLLAPCAAMLGGAVRTASVALRTGTSGARGASDTRRTSPSPESARPPDVVLIVLDTQRADHLGPWASPGSVAAGITPSFDALAAESTIFMRTYATASWTVPSHASLFTGLHPASHGASWRNHRWLDDGFTTLAESLRDRGYRTSALVSNYWLGVANLLQGFESTAPLGERFRTLAIRPLLELLGWPATWMDHGASDAPSALAHVLDARRDDPRPLFLFINLLEPHWRHLPPLADRRATLPPDVGLLAATHLSSQYYGPLMMAGKRVDGPLDETLHGLYAGAVRHQDRVLGQLLSQVDRALDPEHTLLVVTADHGENLGEGGRYDHVFALNDALVHVPLLIRFPERLARGRIDGLVSLVDVSATISEAVGGLDLAMDDGRSLLSGESAAREFVFAESDPYFGHLDAMAEQRGAQHDVGTFTRTLRMAFDGRHRWVLADGGHGVLYDVLDDPAETRDMTDTARDRAETLDIALRAFFANRPPYRAVDAPLPASALDAADLERLRSLGYVR